MFLSRKSIRVDGASWIRNRECLFPSDSSRAQMPMIDRPTKRVQARVRMHNPWRLIALRGLSAEYLDVLENRRRHDEVCGSSVDVKMRTVVAAGWAGRLSKLDATWDVEQTSLGPLACNTNIYIKISDLCMKYARHFAIRAGPPRVHEARDAREILLIHTPFVMAKSPPSAVASRERLDVNTLRRPTSGQIRNASLFRASLETPVSRVRKKAKHDKVPSRNLDPISDFNIPFNDTLYSSI